ncbi:MAG: TonB-dependent receptor plug domain-containing protein, partial [Proteobacteria bacterium]|nr:TonB-dependent receptor plug domain-containing protein [Pseudomonadota bacterium]
MTRFGARALQHPAAWLASALMALALATPALAQDLSQEEFTGFDLESLMNIEVTSVSKKAQSLTEAAAAVYVVTAEDIKRSGVRTVPEALRMVPGVHVARMSGTRWAISVRAFNGVFAAKLLVLIDGRSVYTPLFSGTYWDAQDVVLEDVDRIEVIRGPGGTLWGANAVNGVINILTKSSKDTQGALITAGGGLTQRGFATVRYGGILSDDAHYRVYAKYDNRAKFEDR